MSSSDWTAATDAEGRTYYFNATTQQTQWDPPQGFGADASTGKSYYVNSVTNVTQWDPPPGFGGGGGGGAAAPSAGGAGAGSRSAAVKAAPKRAPASAEPQTVDEKLAARAKKFLAARRQEKARAQPSACACCAAWRTPTSLNLLKSAPALPHPPMPPHAPKTYQLLTQMRGSARRGS